jgi:hypothetical protein
MASLIKELRRQLERTVVEARKIAEEGAEQSLKRLAVDAPRPHDALTSEEKKFRVSLRVHAKQLGDRLDERPKRLIQAVAYEHWHQLLFARFLIENDLLRHPEHGVSLSMDELREIALGENREWVEVATEYAQRMLLRRVFQPEDPALQVSLSPEKRLQLEAKLNSLPRELFLADDSLGWVYQFWQKEAKEAVNESEVKIGANELAPVTQLFTEDYMVLFQLENTLGAWWTARHGKPELLDYTWIYLRLNEDGTPSAGSFYGWPRSAKDLRVLDPCMGSGHFLTFALPILARMRVVEEGLSLLDAIVAVLRDNLFGLELDPRCSQIAAFNLALTAWKLAGKHFDIPQLNLACSGLGINAREDDWLKLAGKDERLRGAMKALYGLFQQAPVLGSLIDPTRVGGDLFVAEFEKVQPLLESALRSEQSDEATHELAVTAQGLVEAARFLSQEFTLVATNVPYLGRGKQNETLMQYCETFYGDAKADLATCFVDRALRFCTKGGSVALVTPQNWLFLGRYRHFRTRLLRDSEWISVTKLGPNAFQDMNWWAATTALVVITNRKPQPGDNIAFWDVSDVKAQSAKMDCLKARHHRLATQASQALNPDHRIAIGYEGEEALLSSFAGSYVGIQNGDSPRYMAYFWEVRRLADELWSPFQLPCDESSYFYGREGILLWEGGRGDLAKSDGLQLKGREAWGKCGIAVRMTRHLPVTLYSGEMYDQSSAVIVPIDPSHLSAIWAFCSSDEFAPAVRIVDQALKVTNATLVKIPFEIDRWQAIADEKYPSGLPKPYSSDPTQWLFNGHPKDSDQPLQVAVARLVGNQWPRQTGASFPECPAIDPDGLESYANTDGIVCLAPLAGEESAAEGLRSLLRAAYGEQYNLAELLKDKKSAILEDWLRDEFFEEHCQIFHQRPFVWHIWDGRSDGFQALVNYHKLDHKTLEKLIYSYLGDWISRQRQDLASGVEGADGRLAAAEHLQGELKNILDGEKPYDVFVRWKPLKTQPIGWEPDLNDGVRVNIRPWIKEARLYRASKPGILRVSPNITYGKDRGKEPARDPKDFPWFKDSKERNNDVHLSVDEKRRGRGQA